MATFNQETSLSDGVFELEQKTLSVPEKDIVSISKTEKNEWTTHQIVVYSIFQLRNVSRFGDVDRELRIRVAGRRST